MKKSQQSGTERGGSSREQERGNELRNDQQNKDYQQHRDDSKQEHSGIPARGPQSDNDSGRVSDTDREV